MVRTTRLPMVMRRAEAGPESVAMTGGMAPPRLAPRMRTMMRPAESVPVAASVQQTISFEAPN